MPLYSLLNYYYVLIKIHINYLLSNNVKLSIAFNYERKMCVNFGQRSQLFLPTKQNRNRGRWHLVNESMERSKFQRSFLYFLFFDSRERKRSIRKKEKAKVIYVDADFLFSWAKHKPLEYVVAYMLLSLCSSTYLWGSQFQYPLFNFNHFFSLFNCDLPDFGSFCMCYCLNIGQ